MRFFSVLAVVCIIAPTIALGAETPKCLESGQSVTLNSSEAVKGQAKRQVSCANVCSDEKITLARNAFSATISVETTRVCKTVEDKKKYGCNKGQVKPRVVITMKNGERVVNVVLSKCDRAGILRAIYDSIDKEDPDSLQELEIRHAKDLREIIASGPAPTDLSSVTNSMFLSTDEGKRNLIEQLRNIGVTNAEEVVERNPDRALEMLRAIADGDKEKAEETARGLNLNKDVVSNVGRISDEMKDAVMRPATEPAVEQTEVTNTNTFTTQQQYVPTDIDKAKFAICSMESGCNYFKRGPITRTGDRAYGKYQIMGVNVYSWTCAAGQCMTPEQFLSNPEMQERVFEQQFGKYAAQYGWSGAARAWFAGPGCVYKWCRGDQLGTGVASYQSRYDALFSGTVPPPGSYNKYVHSAIPSISSGYTYDPPPTPPGPFSVGNPYGYNSPPPQQPQQQQYYAPQPLQQPQYAQQIGGTGVGAQTPGVAQSGTGQPMAGTSLPSGTSLPAEQYKPVLAVTTQSKELKKGNPILVSWSSVGTAFSNVTCTVMHILPDGKSLRIAQNKEGSKIIPTGGLQTGEHKFTFECGIALGGKHRKETSVLLK